MFKNNYLYKLYNKLFVICFFFAVIISLGNLKNFFFLIVHFFLMELLKGLEVLGTRIIYLFCHENKFNTVFFKKKKEKKKKKDRSHCCGLKRECVNPLSVFFSLLQ